MTRLAAMNTAIRGIDFTAKRGTAANQREAIPQNFAWIQHMLHDLAPQGSMTVDFVHLCFAPVLLANGSMSSGSGGEGQIRQALIEADLVECMVALPGQLFTNTQIPEELKKAA